MLMRILSVKSDEQTTSEMEDFATLTTECSSTSQFLLMLCKCGLPCGSKLLDPTEDSRLRDFFNHYTISEYELL